MSSEISTRILALIADVLEMKVSDVRPERHLFSDLGASSLDIAEMVWRIEDDLAFGLGEIPDDVLEHIRTVGDIVDFIEKRSRGGKAAPVEGAEAAVAIGADHRGQALAVALEHLLERQGLRVRLIGPEGITPTPIDFPEIAEAIAHLVARGEVSRGVLVGRDGVGMSIAANKVEGIRAAAAHDPYTARLARARHDANVLCLGAGQIGEDLARECLAAFLAVEFDPGDDGRNLRRVGRIHEIERRRGS